jgi:hypothetical protein
MQTAANEGGRAFVMKPSVLAEGKKVDEMVKVVLAPVPASPEILPPAEALVPVTTDDRLEAIAEEIETLQANAIMRIAERLAEARSIFRYRRNEGGFGGWVEQRLHFSRDKAYDLLNVGERFGNQSVELFDTLAPTILYLLAKPSTPEAAIAEVCERAASGEKISTATTRKVIEAHKEGTGASEADDAAGDRDDGHDAHGDDDRHKDHGKDGKARTSQRRWTARDAQWRSRRSKSKRTAGQAVVSAEQRMAESAAEEEQQLPTSQSGPSTTGQKRATHVDLMAAWMAAPPEERTRFINNIGRDLFGFIPDDWMPAARNWLESKEPTRILN